MIDIYDRMLNFITYLFLSLNLYDQKMIDTEFTMNYFLESLSKGIIILNFKAFEFSNNTETNRIIVS